MNGKAECHFDVTRRMYDSIWHSKAHHSVHGHFAPLTAKHEPMFLMEVAVSRTTSRPGWTQFARTGAFLCLLSVQFGRGTASAEPFEVLHGFDTPPAAPQAGVIEGSDGALYGTVTAGGSYGRGAVFTVRKDGTGYLELHHFTDGEGGASQSDLLEGSDGALYGTTPMGGAYGGGTLFKLNKDGTAFLIVHDFNFADPSSGAIPKARIIEGADGRLYGTASVGGLNYGGIIYSINKDGSAFLKLHDFVLSGGVDSEAGLLEGSDGSLYGTTLMGGQYGVGVAFKIQTDGTGFFKLHDFNEGDGSLPYGDLTEGSDGALYGTTYRGGMHSVGTVFKVNKDGTGFLIVKSLGQSLTGGFYPYAGVIEGLDGALYGATSMGGAYGLGTVFKVGKDGSGWFKVRDFRPDDGHRPRGNLLLASDALLYGTTFQGGRYAAGTVFKIGTDGRGFLTVHDLGDRDGFLPYATVVETTDGVLYGTTRVGGAFGDGIVFKLQKDGSGFATLHDFNGGDGAEPQASLLEASNGVLYGVATIGGIYRCGVVFRLKPDGTGFRTLHQFSGGDGCFPRAALIEASDGALYGTTSSHGLLGYGTIFRISRSGAAFQSLHDFSYDDPENGAAPTAPLIEGGDSILYGTTSRGGMYQDGIAFSINKDGSGFVNLHDFNELDRQEGAFPGAMLEGADGILYGTTAGGGSYFAGTVFRLGRDGLGFSNIHNFDGQGITPTSLVADLDGNLYGTTVAGGASRDGIAFTLRTDGTGFQDLHDFKLRDETNGAAPVGLVRGLDGALYGVTRDGGPGGGGIVFRLDSPGP